MRQRLALLGELLEELCLEVAGPLRATGGIAAMARLELMLLGRAPEAHLVVTFLSHGDFLILFFGSGLPIVILGLGPPIDREPSGLIGAGVERDDRDRIDRKR